MWQYLRGSYQGLVNLDHLPAMFFDYFLESSGIRNAPLSEQKRDALGGCQIQWMVERMAGDQTERMIDAME